MAPPSHQSTTDQKLDLLLQDLAIVKEKVVGMEKLYSQVTVLETTVKEQEKTIRSQALDITYLKEQVNGLNQLHKGKTLRLFNLPGSDDETHLSTKVYDRILKPILVAAKAKGDISTLPQMCNVIEDCFRAGRFSPGANKPPPPIIIKFTSTAIRLAILKNKRINMPSPTEGEKSNGTRRFAIAEDLTSPTYKKLQELMKDERVSKAWTMSGEIWVLPVGDNARSRRVKSIFDSNDLIIS